MNRLLALCTACLLTLAIPLIAEGQRGAPHQVFESIVTALRESGLAEFMKMPEFRMKKGNELLASRILYVRTDGVPEGETTPNGYFVAELARPNGEPMANVAITPDGFIRGAQIVRGHSPTRPLDLSDAAQRVAKNRGGVTPHSIGYVYFHNTIDPGSTIFRPLVAASTEKGLLYLNWRGEAFAHADSHLLEEFPKRGEARRSSVGNLHKIGDW